MTGASRPRGRSNANVAPPQLARNDGPHHPAVVSYHCRGDSQPHPDASWFSGPSWTKNPPAILNISVKPRVVNRYGNVAGGEGTTWTEHGCNA